MSTAKYANGVLANQFGKCPPLSSFDKAHTHACHCPSERTTCPGQAPSAENALSPDEEALLSTSVIVTRTLAFTSFQVSPRSDEDVH